MLDLNKHFIKIRPAFSDVACLLLFVELGISGEFLILHIFWECQQTSQTNLQYFPLFLFPPSLPFSLDILTYFLVSHFSVFPYILQYQFSSNLFLFDHFSLVPFPCILSSSSTEPHHNPCYLSNSPFLMMAGNTLEHQLSAAGNHEGICDMTFHFPPQSVYFFKSLPTFGGTKRCSWASKGKNGKRWFHHLSSSKPVYLFMALSALLPQQRMLH